MEKGDKQDFSYTVFSKYIWTKPLFQKGFSKYSCFPHCQEHPCWGGTIITAINLTPTSLT